MGNIIRKPKVTIDVSPLSPISPPRLPPDAGPTPPPTTYRDTVIADGAVLYWRFGEMAGPTAFDEIGNADGTYVGGPTFGQPSLLVSDPDTCINSNGVGGADVTSPFVDFTGDMSIEFLIQPTLAAGNRIVGKRPFGNNSGLNYWVDTAADLKLRFLADNAQGIASATALLIGTTYHCVCTRSGVGSRDLVIYLDGVLNVLGTVPAIASSTIPLSVARVEGGGSRIFIDEFALYGTALSPAQILDHSNKSKGL